MTRYQGGDDAPRLEGRLGPEPVLEVVDEREEAGCEQRRGNADQRSEPDEAQVAERVRVGRTARHPGAGRYATTR